MTKIIAIIGPTASGKTKLALSLAQKFNGEIIAADSRTIYRGLDIGTAKPTPAQRRQVRHHLVDIVNVGGRFTVVEFKKLAERAIRDAVRRGKTPFLVGGTGLYIDAVLFNFDFPPVSDPELRHHLELESDERLREILQTIDPRSFATIDLNNRRRVMRAVEVASSTGRSFVELKKSRRPAYDCLTLGVNLTKPELNRRISTRFDEWVNSGLIKEVRWALGETSPEWVASLGLHYKYLTQYLVGEIGEKEAVERSLSSLRDYAKRQLTWFRRNKNIIWVNSTAEAEKLTKTFLKKS